MNLMASVLYDKLMKVTTVKKNREVLWNHSLKLIRLLNSREPLTNYVYVCTAEQLHTHKISSLYHASLIVLGEPREEYFLSDCNMLVLPDTLKLEDAANLVADIFDAFNNWDAKMSAIINRTMDVQELFDTLPDVFDRRVVLIDDNFAYVASTSDDDVPESGRMSLDSLNDMKLVPEFMNAKEEKGVFLYPAEWEGNNALCLNVTRRGRYEARMVSAYYNDSYPSDGDWAVFGYFGLRLQELYNKFDEKLVAVDSYGRLRKLIAAAIDRKVVSNREIETTLSAVGWKIDHRYIAIAIKYNSTVELKLMSEYVCTMLETRWHDTCAVSTADNILWIVNIERFGGALPDNFYQELAVFLREGICRAGISDSFNNFVDVEIYCREATLAIELGEIHDPTFWCFRFSSYKLDYMLRTMTEYFEPAQLCCEAVLKLREFDEARDTQYLKTLAVYMKSKYNATQTASELYIHRTTFNNRLERIAEITGLNLDDWNVRLHLALSIALLGIE